MTIRVVVAEDNFLLREGLTRLLNAAQDVEVVGACGDLDELMALIDDITPDVVVTDIRMPPTGTDEGIQAATRLRSSHPDIGVVVLSQYGSPAYALALFEDGSDGRAYLLKDRVSELNELVDAIHVVADGGSVVDPKVVEELVRSRAARASSPLEHLTTREREILSELATGKSNAAIAATLYLSERAVEKHSNSIFSKLGLNEEPDLNRRVKAVLVHLAATAP